MTRLARDAAFAGALGTGAVVAALAWYAQAPPPGRLVRMSATSVIAQPSAAAGRATKLASIVAPAAPAQLAPLAVRTGAPRSVWVAAGAPARDTYAPPVIVGLWLSPQVVGTGELVSGSVETSPNVASVEARLAGYSVPLQKVGIGRFAMSYRVPDLPGFLHRTYTIVVVARNTRGDAVRGSVPITIR